MESGPRRGSPRAPWAAALLVILAVAGLVIAHRTRAPRAEPPVAWWVDPARSSATESPSWTDPRWCTILNAELERSAPFAIADVAALEALRTRLARLSFVESVARCDADARHGLAIELVLRRPVACIARGDEVALVAADGVVLDGTWDSPPRLGAAYLPRIGRADDPLLACARPGDWLAEPEHRAALDVALSMSEHLSEEERAAFGHVAIDAAAATRASAEEPGVRLELEGGRVALFGRAPSSDEPGELSPARKWRSLARALDVYRADPTRDWELVDLRWDRPDLALREPEAPSDVLVVRAEPEPEPRTRGAGGGRRPEPRVTPQVR